MDVLLSCCVQILRTTRGSQVTLIAAAVTGPALYEKAGWQFGCWSVLVVILLG